MARTCIQVRFEHEAIVKSMLKDFIVPHDIKQLTVTPNGWLGYRFRFSDPAYIKFNNGPTWEKFDKQFMKEFVTYPPYIDLMNHLKELSPANPLQDIFFRLVPSKRYPSKEVQYIYGWENSFFIQEGVTIHTME